MEQENGDIVRNRKEIKDEVKCFYHKLYASEKKELLNIYLQQFSIPVMSVTKRF